MSDAGRVASVAVYESTGTLRFRWVYSPDALRMERRDASNNPKTEERSDVCVHQLELDPSGFRRSVRFLNIYGVPIVNSERSFEQTFQVDNEGHVTEIEHLGEDGHPAATQRGVMREPILRDADGLEIDRSRLDASGRPAVDHPIAIVVPAVTAHLGHRHAAALLVDHPVAVVVDAVSAQLARGA